MASTHFNLETRMAEHRAEMQELRLEMEERDKRLVDLFKRHNDGLLATAKFHADVYRRFKEIEGVYMATRSGFNNVPLPLPDLACPLVFTPAMPPLEPF